MVRKNVKLAVCVFLAFLMMALAACGSKSKESAGKSTEKAETKEENGTAQETQAKETKAEETKDEGNTESNGKYATVADFANSAEVQKELEAQKKSLSGSGMDITITGEENKLIYTFIYEELENQEGMAEALEQGMEAEKATFVNVAKSIKLAVDTDNPVVVVRYVDAKGEEIYSAEFTAD
ncbi:MAG: DUF4854 domain-containing protein [Lachnospiraceae bacterium]|nr:DUF4854 domain-containing protein [Lachnospiraceae bacterium]